MNDLMDMGKIEITCKRYDGHIDIERSDNAGVIHRLFLEELNKLILKSLTDEEINKFKIMIEEEINRREK